MLGSTLVLEGHPHTVIGIAPAAYEEMWRADMWMPLAMEVDQGRRGRNFLVVVGRLRPELTLEQARTGLADLAAEMTRSYPEDRYGFHILTLHDVLTEGPRQALWLLLAATGFVLLIACANVTNLLLARGVARQRDMAVRTALGAARGRLRRQLLTETILLSLAGGAVGLALASGLLRLFEVVAPTNFPRVAGIGLDTRVLALATTVAVVAGLLAGVLPALQVARASPNDVLRRSGSRAATASRARSASRLIVLGEIALAVTLVAAAGLTLRSLQRLMNENLGLTTRDVLTFSVALPDVLQVGQDAARVTSFFEIFFFEIFVERLRQLPGVEEAGAISILPIASSGYNGSVRVPERVIRPEDSPLAEFRAVLPGYFGSVGIRLLAGRFPGSAGSSGHDAGGRRERDARATAVAG